MDPALLGALGIGMALVLLVLRVPVAFALGAAALGGIFCFFAFPASGGFTPDRAMRPVFSFLASDPYSLLHSYPLIMAPLFIGMGHVAHRAGFTTDLFHAIRVWLPAMPGNLAIASVVGCGGFSAITGTSVACAAAMGRIAVPEMLRSGYSPALASSCVAAGGTLGSLIPPSLLLVLYGVFTEQSVSLLFLAGVLPGLATVVLYIGAVWAWVRLNPDSAPPADTRPDKAERRSALRRAFPFFILFALIVGGIYLGVFTPTEAAAVAFMVAVLLGVATRRLSLAGFVDAMRETAYQTAAVFAIAISAKMLLSFVALTGVTASLLEWIEVSGFSMFVVMASIVLLYILLGTFLDPIGIILLTIPLTVPLVESYGLSLIWFGIVVIKLLEIGLITPPIGLNVFVIKSVVGDRVPLESIFKGVLIFLAADLIILWLLFQVPAFALFLPNSAF
jgi:tripartite ATP-independent transporter DctM subunit